MSPGGGCSPNRMHRARPSTGRIARSILAIAAVLLLATLAAQVRIMRCAGDCAAATATASCCADSADCCGCCTPAPQPGTAARGDATPMPGQPTQRGACRPGCLTTVAFGGIEFAPAPAGVCAPAPLLAALLPPPGSFTAPLCEPLARGRPFDRGPPRPDRDVALRATTVLLL